VLITTILVTSNRETLARYTPYFVGFLYAGFIPFESSLSGMSMNPARSFAPALHAGYWQALWIYFTAPTLVMLAGAEVFSRARDGLRPFCAKLRYDNRKRCIVRHEAMRFAHHFRFSAQNQTACDLICSFCPGRHDGTKGTA
jgi:aquaporin Z